MSGHGVPGTHAAAGLWPPAPCPALGRGCCAWMGSPCELQEPVPPMLCPGVPEVPQRCPSRAHPGEAEPMGTPRGILGRCPGDVRSRRFWRGGWVPPGRGWRQARAGAAGSRTRPPGWAAGACSGGGPGRGREVGLAVGGGAAPWWGQQRGAPAPCLLCPVPREAAREMADPSQCQEPVWALGAGWKGVPGVCPGCPASLTLSLPRQCWFWAFL